MTTCEFPLLGKVFNCIQFPGTGQRHVLLIDEDYTHFLVVVNTKFENPHLRIRSDLHVPERQTGPKLFIIVESVSQVYATLQWRVRAAFRPVSQVPSVLDHRPYLRLSHHCPYTLHLPLYTQDMMLYILLTVDATLHVRLMKAACERSTYIYVYHKSCTVYQNHRASHASTYMPQYWCLKLATAEEKRSVTLEDALNTRSMHPSVNSEPKSDRKQNWLFIRSISGYLA
jgi:hypothetical protein